MNELHYCKQLTTILVHIMITSEHTRGGQLDHPANDAINITSCEASQPAHHKP